MEVTPRTAAGASRDGSDAATGGPQKEQEHVADESPYGSVYGVRSGRRVHSGPGHRGPGPDADVRPAAAGQAGAPDRGRVVPAAAAARDAPEAQREEARAQPAGPRGQGHPRRRQVDDRERPAHQLPRLDDRSGRRPEPPPVDESAVAHPLSRGRHRPGKFLLRPDRTADPLLHGPRRLYREAGAHRQVAAVLRGRRHDPRRPLLRKGRVRPGVPGPRKGAVPEAADGTDPGGPFTAAATTCRADGTTTSTRAASGFCRPAP
jgi:hypothetical protein